MSTVHAETLGARLIAGSALFGVGWGLAGFCPGPAVASLAYGLSQSVLFVVAIGAGIQGKASAEL